MFSELMIEAREKKGMSKTDLARATGLSLAEISRIESGKRKPKLDTMLQIASILEIPKDKLLEITYK